MRLPDIRRVLATILVLISAGTAFASGEDLSCIYMPKASIDRFLEFFERCAVRKGGEIRIRRKHFKALHFETTGMAEIAILGEGWYYVLPDGTKASMLNSDNGPDRFSEGLARTFVGGKIAYLNERLQIILAPGYDWGWPFAGDTALVCDGCRRERAFEHDEHGRMVGGIWSYIDREGKTVVTWQDTRDKAQSELGKLAIGNPGAFAFLVTLDQPINLLGVQVTMTGYTVETIAENPALPSSYPAGSGVTLSMTIGSETVHLSQISAGYDSRQQASAGGYRVTLLDILDDRPPQALLRIDEVGARLEMVPTPARCDDGSTLTVDHQQGWFEFLAAMGSGVASRVAALSTPSMYQALLDAAENAEFPTWTFVQLCRTWESGETHWLGTTDSTLTVGVDAGEMAMEYEFSRHGSTWLLEGWRPSASAPQPDSASAPRG